MNDEEIEERQKIQRRLQEMKFYVSAHPPLITNDETYNKMKHAQIVEEMPYVETNHTPDPERTFVADFVEVDDLGDVDSEDLTRIANYFINLSLIREAEEKAEAVNE